MFFGLSDCRKPRSRAPLIRHWEKHPMPPSPQRGKAFKTNAYTPFSNAFRPSLATAPKISQRPAPANLLPSFANRLPIACQLFANAPVNRSPTLLRQSFNHCSTIVQPSLNAPAFANPLPSFANRLPIVCQRPSQSLAHRLPTVCPTPLSFQIFPPKFSIYFFIFTLAFLFCHGIMQLDLLRRRNRHQNILERELFTMKKLYKKTTLNASTPPGRSLF